MTAATEVSVLKDHHKIDFSNRKVRRISIPYISDLPVDLQPMAKVIQKTLPESDFALLLRDVAVNYYSNMYANNAGDLLAEVAGEPDLSVRRRKTMYAGALQVQKTNFGNNNVGIYNPDKININVYARMRRHAQVALSLAIIKKPIEHVTFIVSSDSEEIRTFVTWNLQNIYVNLIHDLLMSLDYGCSYLEKVWVKFKNLKLYIKDDDGNNKVIYNGEAFVLKPYAIYPGSFTLLLDKYGELIGIKQIDVNGWGKPVKVKRNKLIVQVHNMEYGNWWGDARLKSAYPWWYWGEICLQFLIRYLERRSSPPIVVEAPDGYGVDKDGVRIHNYDKALSLGMGLMSNSVGVIPSQYNSDGKKLWNVSYLMDDQRLFAFIEVLSFFNKMISRALLVPDSVVSQEGSGGSNFSTADARTDIHLVIEEAIIRELETTLNNDVVPDMIAFNFPPERRLPCTVTIEKLTMTRKQMLKELLLKMMGMINQFARDGGLMKVLPDFQAILGLLEIPYDKIENIVDLSDWDGGGGDPDDSDDPDKEEKIDENNKNKKRKKIPRIIKRPKVIA